MRKLLSLLMIAILSMILVACSDEDVDEPKEVEAEEQVEVELTDEQKAEIEQKVKEEEERKKKEYEEQLRAEQEAKEEEEAKNNESLEDNALELLKEHLGDVAEIELNRDEKSFIITMTKDELIHELAMVLNGEMSMDSWHTLVESFTGMANSMNDLLGGGYSVEVVNPMNTDNVLLLIYDGVVLYDVANDL